jgi:hypothetical protein
MEASMIISIISIQISLTISPRFDQLQGLPDCCGLICETIAFLFLRKLYGA